MNKVLEKIPMRAVCSALYRDRFCGKTGYALLTWSEFKTSMLRTGLISTTTTARAKWFKLATIPEVFCPQTNSDLVAVNLDLLSSLSGGEIERDTHNRNVHSDAEVI